MGSRIAAFGEERCEAEKLLFHRAAGTSEPQVLRLASLAQNDNKKTTATAGSFASLRMTTI
jgi:hypothetical protein